MLPHSIVIFLIMPKPSTLLETTKNKKKISRKKIVSYLNISLKNRDVAVGLKKIFFKVNTLKKHTSFAKVSDSIPGQGMYKLILMGVSQ